MLQGLDDYFATRMAALGLRAQRSETLASNIANADTPNYKARDFDFASRLTQAVEQGRQSQSFALATTSSRHLAGEAKSMPDQDLLYRVPSQSSIDGNTVEMDAERINFADNALRYESNLTVINAKIKSLLSAVQQ